jgi:putative chitobiose transport system permease protein
MTLLGLFLTGPFLWLLFTSLKSGQDVFRLTSIRDIFPSSPTLENFQNVWSAFQSGDGSQNRLLSYFRSTFIIVGLGIVIQLFVSALAAYPLARMDFPGRSLIFFLFLSTMMLPMESNMIVNFITIRKLGLYDTYLAVILPSSVSVFGIFLMRQAYLVIPGELEDAARIDGCNDFQIWHKIMLPLAKPALATLGIFTFVAFWNSFMWPLVILKRESLYPLSVGLSFLAGTFDSNFRLVAAAAVLSMLPVLALFFAMQKHFVKGITAGAIK